MVAVAPNPSLAEAEKIIKEASIEPWTPEQIQSRARLLLSKPDNQVTVPKYIQAKDEYLRRRRLVLEALANGQILFVSTDADGTITFKTILKVEDTRSMGSLRDKHFLRLFVKAIAKLGGRFEVNTARTGVFAGPSVVASEGEVLEDKFRQLTNPRETSEISSLLHEFGIHDLDDPDNQMIYNHLIINGLSGSVTHRPHDPLLVQDSAIKYGNFIEALRHISLPGAEKGFVRKLEDIVENKAEGRPLRTLEYKSIPRIFIDYPGFKTKDYLRYIDLVKKSREQKWSTATFKENFEKLNITLPEKYLAILNPADPDAEEKLTTSMRSGFLTCLTPHALDSYNIVRDELKLEIYKQLARFCRSTEAQEWAEKTYGIPKGTDLFTINGKDVSDIDFETMTRKSDGKKYASLEDLVNDLKSKGNAPKNKSHVLINLLDNLQPYLEIAPNSSKADVLPSYDDVDKYKYLVLPGGDSPGSDAPLLAQSLLLGGLAYKVRGLMSNEDIANAMVELLTDSKNKNHPDTLEKISDTEYKSKSGEIKTKQGWIDVFVKKYQDRIIHADNIHENNAANAGIFSEFFEGEPGSSLDYDQNDKWIQEVLKNKSVRDISTPDLGFASSLVEAEKAKDGYQKRLIDKIPLLGAIPFIGKLLTIEQSGPIFNKLLHAISKILMGSSVFGIFASVTGKEKLATWSNRISRYAFGLNALTSGISRGLVISAIKYPWQFIGEMFGLASAFFPSHSIIGQTLRGLGNTVLIGRANQLIGAENYNFDDFNKEDSKKANEIFNPEEQKLKVAVEAKVAGASNQKASLTVNVDAKEKSEFANIRKVARRLTNQRINSITKLENKGLRMIPVIGPFISKAFADLYQAWTMTKEFIREPGLRKDLLRNFLSPHKPVGLAKISKNSGKEYRNQHSPGHVYAATGFMTLATGLASVVLNMFTKNKFIENLLVSIENFIPTIGITVAAKHVQQDAAGFPRAFTTVNKAQQEFSPEKAGLWQLIGGYVLSLAAPLLSTSIGPSLLNLGVGTYLEGIRQELGPALDDATANSLIRKGSYYKEDPKDLHRSTRLADFVSKFHSANDYETTAQLAAAV
jgi:hypothetical protein